MQNQTVDANNSQQIVTGTREAPQGSRPHPLAHMHCLRKVFAAWRRLPEGRCTRHSVHVLVCSEVNGEPSVLCWRSMGDVLLSAVEADPSRTDSDYLRAVAASVVHTSWPEGKSMLRTCSPFAADSDYCVRASAATVDAVALPNSPQKGVWVWLPAELAASPACSARVGLTSLQARAVRTALLDKYPALRAKLGSAAPPHLQALAPLRYTPAQSQEVAFHVHPELPAFMESTPEKLQADGARALASAYVAALQPAVQTGAQGETAASESGLVQHDGELLLAMNSKAQQMAAARGSTIVTATDVQDALNFIRGPNASVSSPARPPGVSPASELPCHYEDMVARLRSLAANFADGGHWGRRRRPRVLLCYERSGTDATYWEMAGADVATCDLKDTETPHIPHFKCEATYVLDLGWDLIIAHPPCTNLANVGVQWLHRDGARLPALIRDAHEYRRAKHARCPRVVVENPVMHSYGKALTGCKVRQYTQPHHHGTGQTKATGLEMPEEFPDLLPTCPVAGRGHAMAQLPPTADRQELRSRTFIGIAGAMALQWMPVLMELLERSDEGRPDWKVTDLVERVEQCRRITAAKVCFYHQKRDGQLVTCSYRRRHGRQSLDVFGGMKDPGDATVGATLRREISEELIIPQSWLDAMERAIMDYPLGHSECCWLKYSKSELHRVHVWAVQIPDYDEALPLRLRLTQRGWHEAAPGSAGLTPLIEISDDCAQAESLLPYAKALTDAVTHAQQAKLTVTEVKDALAKLATHGASLNSINPDPFRPWANERPDKPVKVPGVKSIQFRRGQWRAWRSRRVEASSPLPQWEEESPQLMRQSWQVSTQWERLSPYLQQVLENELYPQGRGVEPTEEPGELTEGLTPMEEEPEPGRHQQWARDVRGVRGEPCPPRDTSLSRVVAAMVRTNAMAYPSEERHATSDYWSMQQLLSKANGDCVIRKEEKRVKGQGATALPRPTPEEEEVQAYQLKPTFSLDDPSPDVLQQIRKWHLRMKPPYRKGQSRQQMADAARKALALEFVPAESSVEARQVAALPARPQATEVDERDPDAYASMSGEEFSEADLMLPVAMERQIPRQALYVSGLTVCRHAGTRKGKDKLFRVDHALAVRQVLNDTGAGPDFVTTGLLELMPADACVERNPEAAVGPLNGPNGKPITTVGTAVIIFSLEGAKFRREFIVGEGAPLLILGNEFMDDYKAKVEMNCDGAGSARMTLRTRQGLCRVHLSTNAPAPRVIGALRGADASLGTDATSPTIEGVGGATGNTSGGFTVEPLPTVEVPSCGSDDLVDQQLGALDTQRYFLYSGTSMTIPARRKATLWLALPRDLEGSKIGEYFIDRLPTQDGIETDPPLVLPSFVNPDARNMVQVVVWNRRHKPRTIPAFSPVASLELGYTATVLPPEEGITDYVANLSPERLALLNEIHIDEGKLLTPEQLERVRQMLAKHIRAFALNSKDPGKTHLMTVTLPLKEGARPHRHAASKLGEAGREIVDKQCAELEALGIIRKSNSEWASRIVLVGKKGGESRMCIDFRDLNSKLQTLDTPIPLTLDALDRLGGGTSKNGGTADSLFLSTLDLASGFWCLPVAEEDRHLTAFTTGRQKYEWCYLPFGVQSGPSYMCRLMEAALDGLSWDICFPYLDDAGVFSTGVGDTKEERELASFEQMLHRLELVLERFESAGMTCKAPKCHLFCTEAEYLGHLVSREGIKMDPKKVQAVSDVDPKSLNTLEKIRSFLGLASYYRRFIRQFSRIAAPLHDLTKKGVDVYTESQGDVCQAAIIELKAAITSEPVLVAPRFDRPFIVKTDAAGTEGLGGVLSQLDDDGNERVIAYYGRKLNKHERHYTVTEIECLAALESIKNWRPYLWGRPFDLVIDHSALRWLHTMKDTIEGGPASRCMRWILKLQEYNFKVQHKPGVAHKDADGVSRIVANLSRMQVTSPLARAQQWAAVSARHDGCRSLLAATQVAPLQRDPVATARRVQAKARKERNEGMTPSSVARSYLKSGVPSEAILQRAQVADLECRQLTAITQDSQCWSLRADDGGPMPVRREAWLHREAHKLVVLGGLLCSRPFPMPPGANGEARFSPAKPYVPSSMRDMLLTAFHDKLGHPGKKRMLNMLKSRYYWPGMTIDVNEHVDECHECTLAKDATRRPANPRGPPIGSYPFDLLFCDVVDMAPTHDYVEGKSGYKKLLCFVDSLSRWVEAIPFNKDPTSDQVLDAFLYQVVARHGAPREIRSDKGSNIAGTLVKSIYEMTGVNLQSTPANTHDAVGTVERVQKTLAGMTRAADEGGEFWASHLPFLLMSYHSTPHRVTQMSPAALLYGRELRLPAQLGDTGTSSNPVSTLEATLEEEELPDAVKEYATRLNEQLAYAWCAARELTADEQAEAVAATTRRTKTQIFEADDRVCRLLYDKANKLQYAYAGPYRIQERLPNGRYILRDLENRMLTEEFDSANLRAYLTKVDAEELQADEYIVEKLLHHRGDGRRRQFRVKWLGFPKSQATWEPRAELERRCAEMIQAYEDALAGPPAEEEIVATTPSLDADDRTGVEPNAPNSVEGAPSRAIEEYESDALPCRAEFVRGKWSYGRWIATPRGRKMRMFASGAFTADELDSEHFRLLRERFEAGDNEVAALIASVVVANL